MAKLRIKLVLNEGGLGIPLSQLASISEQAEKFVRYLAAGAGMEITTADLIAREFENKSVRFNIEDDGDHHIDEIKGFNSRMAYVSEYKRAVNPQKVGGGSFVSHKTMLQYSKVADALAGHEKLSFGIFHANDEKPYEYRELTKAAAASLKAALSEAVTYRGTLQGRIHTIGLADGWFHFRHQSSDKLIRCTYHEDQYQSLLQAAEHKRRILYVRGDICARRFDREVQSVRVIDVKSAPRLSDASYKAFFGADENYTFGLTTDEYIEAARGYDS